MMALTAIALLLGALSSATANNPCATQTNATGSPDSPCATVAPTLAPTPAPPVTCSTYGCPAGWQPKPHNQLIRCYADTGCMHPKDTPNCCLQVTTPPPTAPPTPPPTAAPVTAAPTPAPPTGCKVQIPKDGFAPWHVYKIMKASAPKIDTAEKLLMGGQTLNMTGLLDIRARRFQCKRVDNELRAVLKAGDTSPVAEITVHTSLTPSVIATQCQLTQISMYKSFETGIPGLRFDYDDCQFGEAKKATLLIGLRKVPNNWGNTPGLAAFFKDVCTDTTGGDLSLRLDYIALTGTGCWAESADYTLMTSDRDCFEPAMVFTLMDAANHFALFPVADNEWDELTAMIPKPAVPGGVEPTAASDSPCALPVPTPAPVHVYGGILQNRLCVAMPELGCHTLCGKVCTKKTTNTITTSTTPEPKGPCTRCYDCEVPEMFYAFFCTILAFIVCNTIDKCRQNSAASERVWSPIQMPEMPYSQLTGASMPGHTHTCFAACFGFFWLSLCSCVFAFCVVNWMDYLIQTYWFEQEMCLKLFDIQSSSTLMYGPWETFGGQWWTKNNFSCVNEVCFFRLFGLFLTIWMSLWCLFVFWRYYQVEITKEKQEIKRVEEVVTFGAAAGGGQFVHGGTSAVACTVQ